MGKWRALIPIALALVVAVAASIFTYKWLQKQTTPKEVVQVETEAVPVVVAAMDLSRGTKLDPKMMETAPYLKESLPPGYASSLESLKGRVLINPLKKKEPILESRLASISVTTGGVSAIVSVGKRALAVKGDKVLGISGFIRPGDRVDVMVTAIHPWSKKQMTKIVLEYILVLATGTQIEEDPSGKPQAVDVYTLEVTPKQGEKLALAAAQGRIHFALRNAADKESVLTRGATVAGTLSSLRPRERRRTTKGKVKPGATFTVEVIKGNEQSKVKVKSTEEVTPPKKETQIP